MPSTMKAVAYTRYGGPEVMKLIDVPIPQPGPGEIQVRVAAAGLNPVDKIERQGELATVFPQTFPAIGGNEFSGVVSAVGEGVTGLAIGDKVYCRSSKAKWNAMAQYVVMPADVIAKAPKSIPLTDAAGIPLAGLTAHQAFDLLDLKSGDRILITGGAGGVGQFAIQLAKIRGAHVTTTASDAGKEYVIKAGADEVVNYRTEKVADLATKFDKVFDTVGGEALIDDVMKSVNRGGKIISVAGPPTPGCLDASLPWWKSPIVNLLLRYKASAALSAAAAQGITYQYFFMHADGRQLQQLAGYVDEGRLRIEIDGRYTMDQFAEAFKKLESGRTKGKIVIEFDATI